MAWVFVRLKARLMVNGLRGGTGRIVGTVVAAIYGAILAAAGFAALAVAGSRPADAAVIAVLFGTALALGWAVVPLLGFGSDETLDPSRLELLPLRRRDLMVGLLAASLFGIGPFATLIALSGAVVGFAPLGPGAVLVVVAVVLQLALCIALSRAIVTALSSALRSRKGRDLRILIVPLVALLPQLLRFVFLPTHTTLASLRPLANVAGWIPVVLPMRAMVAASRGRVAVAAGELVLSALTVTALCWWWARTLDRIATAPETPATARRPAHPVTGAAQPVTGAAQPVTGAAQPVTGAAQPVTGQAQPVTTARPVAGAGQPVAAAAAGTAPSAAGTAPSAAGTAPGPAGTAPGTVGTALGLASGPSPDALFGTLLAWLPRTRAGAVAAREVRVSWRDPRRRVQLVSTVIFPFFVLAGVLAKGVAHRPSLVYVALLAIALGGGRANNELGMDGRAWWVHEASGADWTSDLQGKNLSLAITSLPLVAVIAVVLAALSGGWTQVVPVLLLAAAICEVQLAIGNVVSIRAPWAVPESRSNAFASNTGQGCFASLILILALLALGVLSVPGIIAVVVVHSAVGRTFIGVGCLAYGYGLWRLGTSLAVRSGNRRGPEILERLSQGSGAR